MDKNNFLLVLHICLADASPPSACGTFVLVATNSYFHGIISERKIQLWKLSGVSFIHR